MASKQLGSLEVHHLVTELQSVVGARVDKIYTRGKEEVHIQLHKSGYGKLLVRIIVGKALFLANERSSDETPTGFCMLLRKRIGTSYLNAITQIKPERIVALEFKTKEETYTLYVELFAKGNVIFCDQDNVIIDALSQQDFKERSIRPKKTYHHPSMRFNMYTMSADELASALATSTKDTLVTALAVSLGLGGVYAEEACLIAKVDKAQKPKHISIKDCEALHQSLQSLLSEKIKAHIMYTDKGAKDVVPLLLSYYQSLTSKIFDSYSHALEHYFLNEADIVQDISSPYEEKIAELERILHDQQHMVKAMEKSVAENTKKAELIYSNYQVVSETLHELREISKKHSWDDIKKKLKGHKLIKDVNVKEKKVAISL